MMTMTTTASGAVVGRANACGAMGSMRASRGRWTVARGSSSSSSGEKKFRVRCVSIEASRGVGGEGTGDGMGWDAVGWIARSGAEGGGEGGRGDARGGFARVGFQKASARPRGRARPRARGIGVERRAMNACMTDGERFRDASRL